VEKEEYEYRRRADDILAQINRSLKSVEENHAAATRMLMEHKAMLEEHAQAIKAMDEAFPVCRSGGNKYEQTRVTLITLRGNWRERTLAKRNLFFAVLVVVTLAVGGFVWNAVTIAAKTWVTEQKR